jgi:glycosyltransferase involved in cell wall biosynthesis
MACGTPVIANNRGAMAELIQNGRTGYLTENWQEMIEKIKQIDSLDRSLCRKNVEDNFTLEKMISQYELLYRRII